MNDKKILYNSFKLFVLAVCVGVVTYAWFANESKGNISDIGTTVESVVNLEVSTNGGETWNDTGFYDITDGLIFEHEITGDGIDLYVPALKDNLGNPNYFTQATVNEDYLDVKFTFRSDPNVLIFLESASKADPSSGTNNDILCCSENVLNQSADGIFSKDLIAGAVRVAFINNDSNGDPESTTRMVWAPNKNYELAYNNGSYTAILNSTNPQDYRCLNIVTPTIYDYKNVPNLYDEIMVTREEKLSHGQPYLTQIGEDGTATITARVWIEGNDRETVASLKGGKFKLHFSFLAIKKAISQTPDVSISENSIDGADTTMEYSIDNGINWTDYTNNLTFNTGDVVNIRVKETSNVLQSTTVTLNF